MTRKVKFEELEVGMLTDKGLIKRISKEDRFFGGKPALHRFDLEDSFYGTTCSSVEPDAEYEVLHERGTDEYIEAVDKLRVERLRFIFDAEEDVDFLRALVTK